MSIREIRFHLYGMTGDKEKWSYTIADERLKGNEIKMAGNFLTRPGHCSPYFFFVAFFLTAFFVPHCFPHAINHHPLRSIVRLRTNQFLSRCKQTTCTPNVTMGPKRHQRPRKRHSTYQIFRRATWASCTSFRICWTSAPALGNFSSPRKRFTNETSISLP